MTTITAQVAADLFALYDDDAILPEARQCTAHGWTVLGSEPSGWDRRGYDQFWMVLRNEQGEVYGIEYGRATESGQPDDCPWVGDAGSCDLTRLYPHVVTTYRTRPAKGATASAEVPA